MTFAIISVLHCNKHVFFMHVLINCPFCAGHGIPDEIMHLSYCAARVPFTEIPNVEQARASYEAAGGQLSNASNFGTDPLGDRLDLRLLRERSFTTRIPQLETVFHNAVHGSHQPLYDAICSFLTITEDTVRRYT